MFDPHPKFETRLKFFKFGLWTCETFNPGLKWVSRVGLCTESSNWDFTLKQLDGLMGCASVVNYSR